MIGEQIPPKNSVSQALLLTIVVVAAIVMVVVGAVLWLTDRLEFPFFTQQEEITITEDNNDVAAFLNAEDPVAVVSKELLNNSTLAPPRYFDDQGTPMMESDAIARKISGNELAITIDGIDQDLQLSGNTSFRKITQYSVDDETGYIDEVAHEAAKRSDLNKVNPGEKLRVTFQQETGVVTEVVVYPVEQ